MKLFRRVGEKAQTHSTGGQILIVIIIIMTGAFMVLPLIYAIMSAFKPFEEIFLFPPRFFVRRPTLDNFENLFILSSSSWVPFSRYIFNSVFVVVIVTVLHVLMASLAAYPLAKHTFPGQKIIIEVVIISLMFVPQVTFIPQYILMSKLGLINTYPAAIFPALGSALGLFLMKQFMEQVPVQILESAKIDGSNEYMTFFYIVMPNVKPAWLTLAIFTFQFMWNNPSGQIIYDEQLKSLPVAMGQIIAGNSIARMGVGMAAAVFIMIPPLVLYCILQSKVIETMAHAGIKE